MDDDIPNEPATTFDILTSLVDCADPVQVNNNRNNNRNNNNNRNYDRQRSYDTLL